MYRRNNPLKIGKGYREQDLLTLRVELTVARVEYCKRDKNYFSYTYTCIHWWCMYEKMDESRRFIARFLWLRVQSIRRVWNEKYFPRIDVSFRTFPIQANNVHETMFREIFSALDYYKIIVYRSKIQRHKIYTRSLSYNKTSRRVVSHGTNTRVTRITRMYRFFARTRFHLLDQFQHALPSLSLFPTEENEQLSERTMLHYFRESVNPKRYFLKRNVRARIVIFFFKIGIIEWRKRMSITRLTRGEKEIASRGMAKFLFFKRGVIINSHWLERL